MDLIKYCSSETAKKLQINNTLPPDLVEAAGKFLAFVQQLEHLFLPQSLVFHSGYRCPALNTAVGGKQNSQHMKANALDFHITGFTLPDTYRTIQHSSLKYDQLLLEGKGDHMWIHISHDTSKTDPQQRHQSMEIPNA